MVYLITFTLAFCSIVYELLLGQVLSAFLGNTVLRYSVTIGLYLLAMGIGAMLVRERLQRSPVVSLQIVELALAVLGGYSLCLMFFANWIGAPGFIISGLAHGLIIVIGILTGAEIPLLFSIRNIEKPDSEQNVLGVDYIGAFLGTLVFAFYLYPVVGLVKAALMVATLNAVIGVSLALQRSKVSEQHRPVFRRLCFAQGGVLVALALSLYNAKTLELFLTSLYLEA